MRGSFERSTQIAASPTTVWETLHDVHRLASFSSHLGPVTLVEPLRRWRVPLQDRVGPFRLSAPMEVELVDETALRMVSIRASGQDRGPGTRLMVEASAWIGQDSDDTMLTLRGTYELRGRVAALGASVARRQAEAMIDEFWTNLRAGLDS